MGRGTTSSEELKIRKMLSIIHPFINLLLLCLNSSIFNPLNPDIKIQILICYPYTFSIEIVERIC